MMPWGCIHHPGPIPYSRWHPYWWHQFLWVSCMARGHSGQESCFGAGNTSVDIEYPWLKMSQCQLSWLVLAFFSMLVDIPVAVTYCQPLL